MAPPAKSTDRRKRSAKDREGEDTPSLNLWVGDLSPDTVDADLMAIFGDYGAMDALTSYGSRAYAFVFFKDADQAKKAKEGLQGAVVKGSAIMIEFARPAKPGKHIWIGGISSDVTAEQLEDDLSKFGKLEEFRFLRDRNSALAGYFKLEDAVAAQKSMNGKKIGGEPVRVDFQKPQTQKPQSLLRRDWPGSHHSRGGPRNSAPQEAWMAHDELLGGRRDRAPSNTLWVGYPPSVHMDEQMLHNAMILFGEIERIKSFPSRHYSFVEFRSVDEARRAKEGLQGRLFNDPRIQIMFSSSDLAHGKDSAPLLPGYRGSRPDMLFNEGPYGPVEFLGPSHHMGPNAFSGQFLGNGSGQSLFMRSRTTQGLDLHHVDTDLHDLGSSLPNIPDGNTSVPNWKRLSPGPGMHNSSLGMQPSLRTRSHMWDDGFDMREPKRSRLDGSPANDVSFHGRRVGDGMGDVFGLLHPEREIPGQSHLSPVIRAPTRPEIDHCWRGVIAKGGSTVCQARCVPIGKGLESPLPAVVNCTARTDLDMLTKHYGEAIGFDIVFFLPDSEEDFASYTEFLQYLGLRNRVGVAKCDDGTTLFLVPPSDFLKNVLMVNGPERLYGVVLKLPQQSNSEAVQPPATLPSSRYSVQRDDLSSQGNYGYIPTAEVPALRTDHGNGGHESSTTRPVVGQTSLAYSNKPSASQNYASISDATSRAEVSLTPELLAALASIIPSSSQASSTGNINMPISSSLTSSAFSANVTSTLPVPVQGSIQEHQTAFSAAQLDLRNNVQQQVQQFGGQYGTQTTYSSQYSPYANLPNGPDNNLHPLTAGVPVEGLASNMQQVSSINTRQLDTYGFSLGQSAVSNSRQYHHDASYDSFNARGIFQGTDAAGMLYQPNMQQMIHGGSSAQGHTANMLQNQVGAAADFSAQLLQLQAALRSSGDGDGTSGDGAVKHETYQSTLQLAANLLRQLDQHQQQGSGQAIGGSGNQP